MPNEPLYFKEYQRFRINQYFDLKRFRKEIDFLMEKGILKSENLEYFYFNFVGMLALNEKLIIVFPKYKTSPQQLKVEERGKYSKILFKVFQKYSKDSLNESTLLERNYLEDFEYFNLYSLYKALIEDYLEYGIYNREKNVHNFSGKGEIDWDKTIEEVDPHLNSFKNPIYLEYYSYDMEQEQQNYIQLIQKKLLAEACIYFEKLKFLEIENINLDFHLENDILGDLDFQLLKIESELREVFSERKINLLKLMKNIINIDKNSGFEGLNLYGTKSYHIVWEKVCQKVLGHREDLLKNIFKPVWKDYETKNKSEVDTIVPDILIEKNTDFYILDAKYYNIQFDEKGRVINSKPGVGDISKQFLYQNAFELYHKEKGIFINTYYNAFLFPTEKEEVDIFGEVTFDIFKDKKIKLVKIPTEKMYINYLKNLRCENLC